MKSIREKWMYVVEWVLVLLLLVFLMSSCGCERAIQRIERHCPELFESATHTDTVFIDESRTDTVLTIWQLIDTVKISTPDSSAMVTLTCNNDSIGVALERRPDTITITKTITRYVRESPECSIKHSNFRCLILRPLVAFFLGFILAPTIKRKK